jgi:hypothetical protein
MAGVANYTLEIKPAAGKELDMSVADYFLRAKHWQLFLFLFGTFCVMGTAMTMTEGSRAIRVLSWAVVGTGELSFLSWLWSLGSFLRFLVHPAQRLNAGFFLFSLIYPPLYLFSILAFFPNELPLPFAVIIPLHLLAMFCMLYGLYFVSKSLALAERGGSVSFYNYVGSLFLIWFFPIGVWIIQPRVNRLYANQKNAEVLAVPHAR